MKSLAADLESRGSRLLLRRGAAATVIPGFAVETGAATVLWNKRYGEPERLLDAGIKAWATAHGIAATSFQANLLFEPWSVRTGTGGPYKVFTPLGGPASSGPSREGPASSPGTFRHRLAVKTEELPGDDLDSWRLLPGIRTGAQGLQKSGHQARTQPTGDLRIFWTVRQPYGTGRDIPGVEGTSRLSRHLRFGEISPFQIWHEIRGRFPHPPPADVGVFRSELG